MREATQLGSYEPVAWIRRAPFKLGWTITFGDDGEGLLPLRREGGAWRPTKRMAQARSRRYVKRCQRAERRERNVEIVK